MPKNAIPFIYSRIHVISAPVFLEQTCEAMESRGLIWPPTRSDTVAVQRCPRGQGSWRCNSSGKWEELGPDLSKCQSKNWSSLIGGGGLNIDDPIEIEAILGNTINLYGGDIEQLRDLVAMLTDQFRSSHSETNAR